MRELEFRAWDGKKFYDPVYYAGSWYRTGRDFEDGNHTNDPIEQFTGLTDKNGVKIFEGDVLRFDVRASFEDDSRPHNNQKGLVKIGTTCTAFGCWDSAYCHNLLVIGNIHQNPELLEHKQ